MNQMNVWGMTDIGLVRKENQDAYVTAQHTASGRTVGVVCDGMGGPAGGRVASQIAVSVYLEELEKLLTADQTPQQLLEASAQAAALANQAIQAEAERREECRNMGTTLVSAISYGRWLAIWEWTRSASITKRPPVISTCTPWPETLPCRVSTVTTDPVPVPQA